MARTPSSFSKQGVLALSTGESEYYSLVRCAALAIGLANMSKDLGRHLPAQLHCDSSAATGIAGRRGAGRVRHIEVSTLWLQRHITNRVL